MISPYRDGNGHHSFKEFYSYLFLGHVHAFDPSFLSLEGPGYELNNCAFIDSDYCRLGCEKVLNLFDIRGPFYHRACVGYSLNRLIHDLGGW